MKKTDNNEEKYHSGSSKEESKRGWTITTLDTMLRLGDVTSKRGEGYELG